MARMGVLPTKTSVQLHDADGASGSIPEATPSAAGVMSARHVQMLEELYTRLQGGSPGIAPVIIEKAADTSHLATKDEVRALLSAIPGSLDMTPQIQALRGEIATLQRDATAQAQKLLAAPTTDHEAIDAVARSVCEGLITGFEGLDERVRELERFVGVISALAETKGAEAA